jgi:hypothetical protein
LLLSTRRMCASSISVFPWISVCCTENKFFVNLLNFYLVDFLLADTIVS